MQRPSFPQISVRTRAPRVFAIFFVLLAIAGPLAAAQDPPDEPVSSTEEPSLSTEYIQVLDNPEARELTVVLGPIDLPARTSHHELEQLPVERGTVPFDLTIRGYRAEIFDGEGNPVPQVVLHHLNVLDPGRRELFLPIMLRVLAASHETQPVSLPGWLFGVPMRGGAEFWALTMLHNPTARSYEGVTVRLVIQYERRRRLPVYRMVPFHIDIMFPTGSKAYDLPAGHSTRSYEGSPTIRGLIVGMGGHLHQYATRLRLEDVTDGSVLYDIHPNVGEDGHIESIPALLHGGKGVGALVEPDHVYRITAEYLNPTGAPIPEGGMGSIAGGFIPLEEWPASNPRDPLYIEDYQWVLASLSQHGIPYEHQPPDHDREPSRRPR